MRALAEQIVDVDEKLDVISVIKEMDKKSQLAMIGFIKVWASQSLSKEEREQLDCFFEKLLESASKGGADHQAAIKLRETLLALINSTSIPTPQKPRIIPSPIPPDDDLLGSTDPMGHAAKLYAMRVGREKKPCSLTINGKRIINMKFSMKLPDSSFGEPKTVEPGDSISERISAFIANMDAESAKIWDAVFIAWGKAYHTKTLNEYGGLEAHANHFLEKFGYAKKKRTFTPDQKERFKERLHGLSTIFVDGDVCLPNGKPRPFKGHLLEVDSLGSDESYLFRIRPTMLFMDMLTSSGTLEVGNYSAAILQIDATKGVGEVEYKLINYFRNLFRAREHYKNWDQAHIVKTVLENSEIGIETNKHLYARKMDYIYEAAKNLVNRGFFSCFKWEGEEEARYYTYADFLKRRFWCTPGPETLESSQIRSEAYTERAKAAKKKVASSKKRQSANPKKASD